MFIFYSLKSDSLKLKNIASDNFSQRGSEALVKKFDYLIILSYLFYKHKPLHIRMQQK